MEVKYWLEKRRQVSGRERRESYAKAAKKKIKKTNNEQFEI
jgi:hypothetical protein